MRAFRVRKPARLDEIARDIYGTEQNGAFEALLAANPRLAGMVGDVPEGTVLETPELARATPVSIRPWR